MTQQVDAAKERGTNQDVQKGQRPSTGDQPDPSQIDVAEKGRDESGKPISLNRRLFMQFMAFGNCRDIETMKSELAAANPQAVLYQDVNDPFAVGLLLFAEDPAYFVDAGNELKGLPSFREASLRPEYTMLGRTYSIGYENDLQEVLIDRPVTRVCNPELKWAVWYPVRRSGEFERQPAEEQRKMLMEHGGIGHAFGKAGLATDIRLACHGLNKDDNDFIVGLLGSELFPLSAVVQRMRKTRQTSQYITSMGPFFVGKIVWQTETDRSIQ